MTLWFWGLLVSVALGGWLVALILSRRPITGAEELIQQRRYEDAAMEAARVGDHFTRAEALKLQGRYEEAIAEYGLSGDSAADEGIALCLAHLGRDLDRARDLMEKQIAWHPRIQEFQALALAYVLLRMGRRVDALRIYRDNVELLETRFRDDYTDPDPQFAEVLFLYARLAEASGEAERAETLRDRAEAWGWTTAGTTPDVSSRPS